MHMANNAHVHEIEGVEPLGFTGEAGEQREEELEEAGGEDLYIEIRARARTHAPCTHAHTGGLSGIHPRSQISIMSAAMRRYTLLFPSPFSLSFSICRFAFALLPCPAPLPFLGTCLLFSGAMRETRHPRREERNPHHHRAQPSAAQPRPIDRGYPRR